MPIQRLVVIGASAGGIDAVRDIAGALPEDFPAPICVVIHTAPHAPGILADILNRTGPLVAVTATDKQRLAAGHIYVPPPDHHVVIEPARVRVSKGPTEHRFRPAIDPLFRSAAQVYGPASIGVVLTGNLDDGTAGLWAIRQLGGTAIVQDPTEARYPSMPSSALAHVKVQHCVRLVDIAPLLVALTTAAPGDDDGSEKRSMPEHINVEVNIAKGVHPTDAGLEQIAVPSPYACPECHGVLLKLKEEDRARFRCHTGHAYSVESLLAAVRGGIEESLWTSIRTLEEGGLLLRDMAEHFSDAEAASDVERLKTTAQEMRRQADVIRSLASGLPAGPITKD